MAEEQEKPRTFTINARNALTWTLVGATLTIAGAFMVWAVETTVQSQTKDMAVQVGQMETTVEHVKRNNERRDRQIEELKKEQSETTRRLGNVESGLIDLRRTVEGNFEVFEQLLREIAKKQ